MLPGATETHSFGVEIQCRYLLHVPPEVSPSAVLVLALHGYASNPEDMLRLTLASVGRDHLIASLQAPNQHYFDQGLPSTHPVPAYNWGVRFHWEESVRLHHEMLNKVLFSLRHRFEISPEQCLLMGFSQPVGLNYRFAGTYPDQVGGLIGICGGVPRDWDGGKYLPVAAPILHISRDEDEFYPKSVAEEFPNRLRKHASDVEFHMLPGKHRFPSKAGPLIRKWMARVYAVAKRVS
jgi:predicted esterase